MIKIRYDLSNKSLLTGWEANPLNFAALEARPRYPEATAHIEQKMPVSDDYEYFRYDPVTKVLIDSGKKLPEPRGEIEQVPTLQDKLEAIEQRLTALEPK